MEKKELERTGELCPECGSELVIPQRPLWQVHLLHQFPEVPLYKERGRTAGSDEICPNCGAKMVMKKGRYGSFLACSNYPQCKTIKSLKEKEKPQPTEESRSAA
ncbi:MAG: topoisomerase DNA-binding C4 zinc finger domain-containing protein [Merdibacter sp.]